MGNQGETPAKLQDDTTAQKGELPQSRALHLDKVTLAAEVSLTEEAREDSRRRSPARRP